MAASGTYAFSLDVGEMVAEAAERAKIDPARLTGRHVNSIRRSFEFLNIELENRNVRLFQVDQQTFTTTRDDVDIALPTGTMDVISASLLRDGISTPMNPMSREEYLYLPKKDTRGRPHRYYVERKSEPPVMFIYNAPENGTDQVVYYRLRQIQNVGAMANTLDHPRRYHDAVAAGLAWKFAEKFNEEKEADCLVKFERALSFAKMEDRERADTIIKPQWGHRGRRMR